MMAAAAAPVGAVVAGEGVRSWKRRWSNDKKGHGENVYWGMGWRLPALK